MRSFLITCVLLGSLTVSAQQPDSLSNLLDQLEQKYAVSFSYQDELVSREVSGFELDDEMPLDEILDKLQRISGLRFESIGDTYVAVRLFEPTDTLRICGRIFDGKDPLFGVLIKSDSGLYAISNEEGAFHLNVPYSDVLSFQHLGYVTKRRSVPELLGEDCPKLFMKEEVAFLEEITISDYTATGIYKVDNQVIIKPKDLTVLPGLIDPDILQSIQQTPGVNSPYETVSGIHVRGGSPDQNLVLWNGITTYNQGHFFGMLSAINPYITDEVTFVKNGTSAAYGGRVSSVINVKTDESVADEVSGGAGFNMLNADVYLITPVIKDKLSFTQSFRRSYTDVLSTPTYGQYAKRVFQNTKIDGVTESVEQENDFFFTDNNTSIVFQPNSKNTIRANSLYYKNKLRYRSESSDGDQYQDDLLTQNEGYNLSWKMVRPQFIMDQSLSYSRYLLRYEFAHTENDTTSTSSKKNLIDDMNYRLGVRVPFSEAQELYSGYELNRNHTRYAFEDFGDSYRLVLDQDDRVMMVHSPFVEYTYAGKRLNARAGLRGNYYDSFNRFYLEPRLNLSWLLFNPLQLTASGEYRTQHISQIKESVVSDLSLENQVWKLASKDRFPIIESYQVTSGFVYRKSGWFLELEGYYKSIEGVTSLTFGFLNPIDNDYKTGNSVVKGFDTFMKKQWGNYKSWISYSYLNTQNTFTGLNNDEPFPGNWNIRHLVNWSQFYTVGQLHLSIGWNWHTGKSYTQLAESQESSGGPITIGYDQINGENLPVYHRLDFSALYEFEGGKSMRYRVGLSILNVYNRKNILNREFRTTPSLENELIDTRIYSLGITPNLVFRFFW